MFPFSFGPVHAGRLGVSAGSHIVIGQARARLIHETEFRRREEIIPRALLAVNEPASPYSTNERIVARAYTMVPSEPRIFLDLASIPDSRFSSTRRRIMPGLRVN